MNQTCKTEITDVLTHLADAGFQCMPTRAAQVWVNYWFFFQLNQSFSHKQNHPRERGRCSLKDDGTRQSSSLLKNSLTPPALSLFLSPSFSHTHTHTHTRSSSIYTRNSIMTLNQNSSCASIVNDGKQFWLNLSNFLDPDASISQYVLLFLLACCCLFPIMSAPPEPRDTSFVILISCKSLLRHDGEPTLIL